MFIDLKKIYSPNNELVLVQSSYDFKNARRTKAMLVIIQATNSEIKCFIVGIMQDQDNAGL